MTAPTCPTCGCEAVVHVGDVRNVLRTLPDESVHCCVTSPAYWGLRDYGVDGQLGLEATPEEYVANLVTVFREVRRVLRGDGTLWLVLGDSYATSTKGAGGRSEKQLSNAGSRYGMSQRLIHGLKDKDLVGIPWRVAFALQADGWYLRSDIIWAKTACMPESVRDRCTSSHEYLFMLTKRARYYYDAAAIAERTDGRSWHDATGSPRTDVPGQTKQDGHGRRHAGFNERYFNSPPPATRNKRDVWTIGPQPFTDWTQTSRRVRVEPGDAGDGIERITSPDCPVHGALADPASTECDDEHGRALTCHSPDRESRLAQEPADDSVPTQRTHDEGCVPDSSGSLALMCVGAATGHSSGSRRTGPDPATSLACTASARMSVRTDDTQGSPESCGSVERTPESNTSEPDSASRRSARRAGHSEDMSSCTCSYYRVVTESVSHFATFPEKLVEPCILAGCPVGGTVLDPFTGSGTTGAVACRLGRRFVGIELNPEYAAMAEHRIAPHRDQMQLEVQS